jgi:outer membrane protein assembly factor BamB
MKNVSLLVISALCLSAALYWGCGISGSGQAASYSMANRCSAGGAARSNNFVLQAEKFSAGRAVFEQFPLADSSGLTCILPLDQVNMAFATENGYLGIGNSSLIRWCIKVDEGRGYVAAGMCRDSAGTLYAVTTSGAMVAISSQGSILWKKQLIPASAHSTVWLDLLALPDGIVAAADSMIFKVSLQGAIMWQQIRSSVPVHMLSADSYGNIVSAQSLCTPGATDTLVCWNPDGILRWKAVLPFVRLTTQPLSIGRRMIVGGVRIEANQRTPVLFCFGDDGAKCWETALPETPRFLSADDSMLFIVASEPRFSEKARTQLLGLSREGHKLWSLYVSARAAAPLLVSSTNLGFLGVHEDAAADFMLFGKNGVLENTLSFADAQDAAGSMAFLPQPAVLDGGDIVFPCSQKSGIVLVGAKRSFLAF